MMNKIKRWLKGGILSEGETIKLKQKKLSSERVDKRSRSASMKRFTFDMPVELHKQLKVLSATLDRTMAELVIEALAEKMERTKSK